jgi:hypothetical protein
MKKFKWLKTYFSPFKPIIPKFYFGKIAIGTPIFLPRKWVKNKENPGYLKSVPKIIGFDFVSLGWKTKWDELDIRFEYHPIWSFVFFKYQFAILFVPEFYHYWECWLIYENHTDKTKTPQERIAEGRNKFPCISTSYKNDIKETTCYWDLILKEKYCGQGNN